MKRIIFAVFSILLFSLVSVAQEVNGEKKPFLIVDYQNSDPGSKKELMDSLRAELDNNPNCVGVIRIQSIKKDEIFRQYRRVLKGILFIGLPMERITFAIIPNSKEEKVEYWSSLPNVEIPNCEECIIIRAKDFPKIEDLFKPAIKKRKK